MRRVRSGQSRSGSSVSCDEASPISRKRRVPDSTAVPGAFVAGFGDATAYSRQSPRSSTASGRPHSPDLSSSSFEATELQRIGGKRPVPNGTAVPAAPLYDAVVHGGTSHAFNHRRHPADSLAARRRHRLYGGGAHSCP